MTCPAFVRKHFLQMGFEVGWKFSRPRKWAANPGIACKTPDRRRLRRKKFNLNLNLCCESAWVNAPDSCSAVDLCGEQGKQDMPWTRYLQNQRTLCKFLFHSSCNISCPFGIAKADRKPVVATASESISWARDLEEIFDRFIQ